MTNGEITVPKHKVIIIATRADAHFTKLREPRTCSLQYVGVADAV